MSATTGAAGGPTGDGTAGGGSGVTTGDGGPVALPLDGSTHVNLTVTDVERSAAWYQQVFGMVQVNDVTPPGSGFRFRTLLHPASLASVVLGQPLAPVAPDGGDRFDEHRVGLHHLAYHVPAEADLERWREHLDRLGVVHSGVTRSPHEAGTQLWFRDPDHIWLELYWTNRAFFLSRLRQQWRAARDRGESWLPR